jgi:hypothetical protein
MSLALELFDKALAAHVAEAVTEATATLSARVTTQAAAIAALQSTVGSRNMTITTLETENAALRAENERLRNAPTPTDPMPPVDEEPETPRVDLTDILYQRAEIMKRPTTGADWERLAKRALGTWAVPNLGDNNAQGDADVIAGALYAVRMNDDAMRAKVVNQLALAIKSPLTRTLELGRGLAGYVIAANLIGYAEPAFAKWVHAMVAWKFGAGDRWGSFDTILATDHGFNSNWATQCRRSVIVASIYLQQVGTDAQKADAEKWLRLSVLAHKRDIGAEDNYAELPPLISSPTGWSGDASPVVGINPAGTTKEIGGKVRNLDGARPADWLRSKVDGREDREATVWPPNPVTYHWEGLTPQIVTAAILHQHELCAFDAADNAIVRATKALYGEIPNDPPFINPAAGDDKCAPWIVNHFAGTRFPTEADDMPDKAGVGWMSWYLGEANHAN